MVSVKNVFTTQLKEKHQVPTIVMIKLNEKIQQHKIWMD